MLRKPGMSRDDLFNQCKYYDFCNQWCKKFNPNAIIIVVSNPLDAMVYTSIKTNWF